MSKKTAYYLPSNISFVFVVEFNCFPATWMCTSTMQDWTYPLISAKQAVLNLSQMEDFLSSPAILLTEKKKSQRWQRANKIPVVAGGVAAELCMARGRADTSGAFSSASCCAPTSYTGKLHTKELITSSSSWKRSTQTTLAYTLPGLC